MLAPLMAAVVINEIHYDPDVKTELVEFIELHNPDSTAVDLAGWAFTDGVQFSFPPEAVLGPGAYLVVAQDPAALRAKFGVNALGPWRGRLASGGERIVLRNQANQVADQVDYQLGFPWPTVGDSPGYSIELVNPALDNDLGGSWRASTTTGSTPAAQTLLESGSTWRYQPGRAEASTPRTAWRALAFDDGAWPSGAMPVGYGENLVATPLADMRNNYTAVFFRRTFTVPDPSLVTALDLEALYDDGFVAWINGTFVANRNAPGNDPAYNATASSARESLNFETITLPTPAAYLLPGANVIAVLGLNASIGGSSDFFMDFRLIARTGPADRGPTPGARNSVFSQTLPPHLRQVRHQPDQPRTGQPVTVTVKITDADGVAGAQLEYQVVEPGNYIELTAPAYKTGWVTVPINDAGTAGDAQAGDDLYTALLPGSLQTHRRLIRYRLAATDRRGQTIAAPYPDDPQPNFAYFVYDGLPAWTGAIQPGNPNPARGQPVTYGPDLLGRLPVYHLLTTADSVMRSQFLDRYGGDAYRWLGTLVYDGRVYDHIRYRARGGVWRYAMGKNMWKFDFNRGHDFQPRDDYRRRYDVGWTKLNLGACIQQGDYLHRGEQGLFESVGFRLFNLAGVEASKTHFVHFRVLDDALEADPDDQYQGDFWGLYLATEQLDTRFLQEHGLPDGNFYKMEGGTGELNNQGATAVSDKSDLNTFMSAYRGNPTDAWWWANFDVARYTSYQTIVQGIHHYDICHGKNYFYLRHPESGVWSQHPWDLDLTWADNMYDRNCDGVDEFKNRLFNRPTFRLEWQNRIRELRDLLFNEDQTWKLIDEYAAMIDDPAGGPSFVDADRALWDYHPIMASAYVNPSKSGQGRFYQIVPSKDFPGMVQKMKDYVLTRGAYLDNIARDNLIPARPTIAYTGAASYPVDRLRFQTSPFSASAPFAALEWRLGEVSPAYNPPFDPAAPKRYEVQPAWTSGELTTFNAELSVPSGVAKVGHAYRARVRMKDATGRWSQWSPPVEFMASSPAQTEALQDYLRVTELMYNPPAGAQFEFIELHNPTATNLLDLSGLKFTAGIDFTIPPNTTLAPGGYLLVVGANPANDFSGFRAHYGLGPAVAIVGPYQGALANEGETVTLKTAANGPVIFSFTYNDGRGWPLAADGAGHSLVPLTRFVPGHFQKYIGSLDYGGNWRASAFLDGSPGRPDPTPVPGLLINELMAHTDFADPLFPEYDSNDWIELVNVAPALNLSNYFLSDDAANLRKWALPTRQLPAGALISFDEVTGFHAPITSGFGLNKAGEQLFLSYLTGGPEDRVVDAVSFKAQDAETSWGRRSTRHPYWERQSPTRSQMNQGPIPAPVINEIMYRPLGTMTPTNWIESLRDEFIELHNPLPVSYPLFDTNGTWRLNGGADFQFPPGTTLPPGGFLLVVNFDPADPAQRAAFRRRYGLADQPTLLLLGPYSGSLANTTDRVALEKPEAPDLPGEPVAWAIVDEVIYSDQAPWPYQANLLASLQRGSPTQYGNDPESWTARFPTAAAPNYAPSASDFDGDGLPDEWEYASGLSPTDPNGRDGPDGDPDQDGLSNLAEYRGGTDPIRLTLRFRSLSLLDQRVRLDFLVPASRTVTVEYTDAFVTPAVTNSLPWPYPKTVWQPLTTFTGEATPKPATAFDTTPNRPPQRFYRLFSPWQ